MIDIAPTVSIILITYNRQKLLVETIKSILNQTYSDFELIVVDNYSDYDFFQVIKSFNSNKIKAYQNQNNGTIAINRNFGIDKAHGKYLAFCDDDDLWLPNKLETQMQYLLSGRADLVSSAIILFGEGLKKQAGMVVYKKYKNSVEPFLSNKITPSTVVTVNRPEVRFNENSDYNCSEDWALWLKLIILGFRIYQIETPLIYYRVTSSNLTKLNKIQPDFKAIRILCNLHNTYKDRFQNKYLVAAVIYHCIKAFLRTTKILKMLKKIYESCYFSWWFWYSY